MWLISYLSTPPPLQKYSENMAGLVNDTGVTLTTCWLEVSLVFFLASLCLP